MHREYGDAKLEDPGIAGSIRKRNDGHKKTRGKAWWVNEKEVKEYHALRPVMPGSLGMRVSIKASVEAGKSSATGDHCLHGSL